MNIRQFLQEETGKFSATRLAFLVWAFGVLAVWIYRSIVGGAIADIPDNVLWALLILMTGKGVQKFAEQK